MFGGREAYRRVGYTAVVLTGRNQFQARDQEGGGADGGDKVGGGEVGRREYGGGG